MPCSDQEKVERNESTKQLHQDLETSERVGKGHGSGRAERPCFRLTPVIRRKPYQT
jgi:hypothetical protein